MWDGPFKTIMPTMTRPAPSSKLLLVETAFRRGKAPKPAPAVAKRYRLARLRFDGRAAGGDCRYEHLTRVYD